MLTFNDKLQLLSCIPTDRQEALSVREIAARFSRGKQFIDPFRRRIYDAIKGFKDLRLIEAVATAPTGAAGSRWSYFRVWNAEQQGLLLPATHLRLSLGGPLMDEVLEGLGLVPTQEPEHRPSVRALDTKMRKMEQHLRFLAGGYPRKRATISPGVLAACVEALVTAKRVAVDYRYPDPVDNVQTKTISLDPMGLIDRDGTLYLVGSEPGVGGRIRSFALQRVLQVTVTKKDPDQQYSGLDLDNYIANTYSFSHPLPVGTFPLAPRKTRQQLDEETRRSRIDPGDAWIELRLRIAPRALFHFNERPFLDGAKPHFAEGRQDWGSDETPETWGVVHAQVRYGILLLPHLLSFGGWIRVEKPEEIRVQMQQVTRRMAELYP